VSINFFLSRGNRFPPLLFRVTVVNAILQCLLNVIVQCSPIHEHMIFSCYFLMNLRHTKLPM